MLKMVTSNHPHRNTVRKMITLKNRKSYKAYLRELKKYGITPYKQIELAKMICFHINGKQDTWRLLKKHPSVRRIETDAKVQASPLKAIPSSTSQIPWGIKRIHAPKAWKRTRGKGVKVAVLDTGISPHPDLTIAGGVNTIQNNGSFHDNNGHGTYVAGIAAAIGKNSMPFGVAPEIKLYAVKALDKDGSGHISDIIEGLEWCIRNRMNIINMSFGSSIGSEALHAMIKQAHHKGIFMTAAVGNSGPNNNKINYPASYQEVVAVAATDRQNQISSYSSRGKGIDVAAPGSDIVSTNNQKGFSEGSGTSAANPHVSGTIALLLANDPKLSPQRVRSALTRTAKFLKGFKRTAQGAGLIRTDRALSWNTGSKLLT